MSNTESPKESISTRNVITGKTFESFKVRSSWIQVLTVVYSILHAIGVSVNSNQDFDKQGNMTNENIISRIETLGRDLTAYGSLITEQYKKDLQGEEQNTFAARYR
jgi:hypothetical protein